MKEIRAFLGIEESATGFRWRWQEVDEREVEELRSRVEVSDLIARVLFSRGVRAESAEYFLRPKLRDQLPDPECLKDMGEAAERLGRAIERGERVTIVADYDVDGATSAALLLRFVRLIGLAQVETYVPDRLAQGYGLHSTTIQECKDRGVSLVVAVDCGTNDLSALELARRVGIDVIVLDHHALEGTAPPAFAVVNPKRNDDTSGLTYLCSAGVTFLTILALRRFLERRRYPVFPSRNLLGWLDLVALGTICDIVPLRGLNRVFVAQGLKVMNNSMSVGLRALIRFCRLKTPLTVEDVSFILGPRLNASGRIGDSQVAVALLSAREDQEAERLCRIVEENNAARKKIEAEVFAQALRQIDQTAIPDVIFSVGSDWHPGVIGLTASRLSQRFNRPAVVISVRDGVGHGSGRSIPGFDLAPKILRAVEEGMLLKGGGHARAAGFSIKSDAIRAFKESFSLDYSPVEMKTLDFDGALTPKTAREVCERLRAVEPYGEGNPIPRLVLVDVMVSYVEERGENIFLTVVGNDNHRLNAVAFRARGTPLGRALLASRDRVVHLAGEFRRSSSKPLNFIVQDLAYPA